MTTRLTLVVDIEDYDTTEACARLKDIADTYANDRFHNFIRTERLP